MAMVMIKCSGLEKRKRKTKWAQGKGEFHGPFYFGDKDT
jgi:hypothetical protein